MVVAKNHHELIVKRIVGLPGEEIEVKVGRIYINQTRLTEHYTVTPGTIQIGAGRLAEGKYALLGDNRSLLISQQIHAVVPKDQIVGKVVWSFHL